MAIERARSTGVRRTGTPASDRDALASGLGWLGVGFGVASLAALMTNRRRAGVAAAAASGMAALGALRRRQRGNGESATAFTHAITINKPVDEVYGFWRNFENFPRFMRHLESVQVIDERRSFWSAKGPAGTTLDWTSEITEDRPNECIAWRSVPGGDVENAGSVRFSPAPGNRGTEVRLEMEAIPPGGRVAEKVAKLFRQSPEQKAQDDLRAFKQLMETGEVVQSDASVVGGPHPAQPLEQRAAY